MGYDPKAHVKAKQRKGSDKHLHEIAKHYEELRRLIDGGSESMTHHDAVEELNRLLQLDEEVSP